VPIIFFYSFLSKKKIVFIQIGSCSKFLDRIPITYQFHQAIFLYGTTHGSENVDEIK